MQPSAIVSPHDAHGRLPSASCGDRQPPMSARPSGAAPLHAPPNGPEPRAEARLLYALRDVRRDALRAAAQLHDRLLEP